MLSIAFGAAEIPYCMYGLPSWSWSVTMDIKSSCAGCFFRGVELQWMLGFPLSGLRLFLDICARCLDNIPGRSLRLARSALAHGPPRARLIPTPQQGLWRDSSLYPQVHDLVCPRYSVCFLQRNIQHFIWVGALSVCTPDLDRISCLPPRQPPHHRIPAASPR
jgi:hypothetical protein